MSYRPCTRLLWVKISSHIHVYIYIYIYTHCAINCKAIIQLFSKVHAVDIFHFCVSLLSAVLHVLLFLFSLLSAILLSYQWLIAHSSCSRGTVFTGNINYLLFLFFHNHEQGWAHQFPYTACFIALSFSVIPFFNGLLLYCLFLHKVQWEYTSKATHFIAWKFSPIMSRHMQSLTGNCPLTGHTYIIYIYTCTCNFKHLLWRLMCRYHMAAETAQPTPCTCIYIYIYTYTVKPR